MGIENNVYGELLSGLQSENQKLLLTKLNPDGTLEKHLYVPGTEPEEAEALAQQAALRRRYALRGLTMSRKQKSGSRSLSVRKTAC
ncbi:MAG: hypothetical protein V8S58_09530 [Lachnospiraceae bacterium]